jgi:hypothetical protein
MTVALRMAMSVLACAAGLAELPAQTYVVDPGGGGHFRDLQAAVAAVPEGSTLHVKPGTYGLEIHGKSLTVLAETPGTVKAALTAITKLREGQQVTISGITIDHQAPWVYPLELQACLGPVVLDRITMRGPIVITADRCESLHLLGCTMAASPGISTKGGPTWRVSATRSNLEVAGTTIDAGSVAWYYAPGTTALHVDRTSFVAVAGSWLSGGPEQFGLGLSGGEGLALERGSIAHVFGTGPFDLRIPSCLQGGTTGSSMSRGGHALHLTTGSLARVFGCLLKGGTATAGPPARDGLPVSLDESSKADLQDATGPSAFLAGTMAPNQTVKLSLRARPSSPAALLLGTRAAFLRPPVITLGALLVQPAQILGGLTVPASGLLEIPVALPASWPRDSVVLAQFLTLDALSAEVQASNSFAAITR